MQSLQALGAPTSRLGVPGIIDKLDDGEIVFFDESNASVDEEAATEGAWLLWSNGDFANG
jgi:hypothetical protein